MLIEPQKPHPGTAHALRLRISRDEAVLTSREERPKIQSSWRDVRQTALAWLSPDVIHQTHRALCPTVDLGDLAAERDQSVLDGDVDGHVKARRVNRSLQHRSDVRCCNMALKQDRIDRQARFWVLMAGGSTLTAACEAVGVNRKSGCRWRQATGVRIPRKRPVSSGRYLSLGERLQIADLYLGGAGVRAIAVGISRSPATVSRELRRNGSAPTPRRAGKYGPYAAQKQAELRGRRPKASKFDHLELAAVVQSKLCVKWSPEQTSLHLAEEFAEGDRPPVLVPLPERGKVHTLDAVVRPFVHDDQTQPPTGSHHRRSRVLVVGDPPP